MTSTVDQDDSTPRTLADALDRITRWITKYTVLPDNRSAATLALWAAHTWVSTSFYTSPRVIMSSPVAGSGKTRVLELLAGVSYQSKMTLNSSTAAIYRRISKALDSGNLPQTLLYDEVDALFGARPTPQAEDMRALLNAGYKAGATVDRCEGDSNEVREFKVFAPVALAGLAGHMPDTITTRAITIEMKKRRRGEKISPYRERTAHAEMSGVREFLASWANGMRDDLAVAEVSLPDGVEDRPAEVWEPLLIIADAAGGDWPTIARDACRSFVFAPVKRPPSQGIELLSDIRKIMGHDPDDDAVPVPADRIRTVVLVEKLNALTEGAWREMNGKDGITTRRVAQLLSGYDVRPVDIRDSIGSGKGYTVYETTRHGKVFQAGLGDAWSRYLDTPSSSKVRDNGDNGDSAGQDHQSLSLFPEEISDTSATDPRQTDPTAVTENGDGSVTGDRKVTENRHSTSTVTAVAAVTDFSDSRGEASAETQEQTALTDAVRDYVHAAGTIGRGQGELKTIAEKNGCTVMDLWAIAEADSSISFDNGRYYQKDPA